MTRTDDSTARELVWRAQPALAAPDDAQAALLASWAGPTLALGGPGTGKTTLIAHAAVHVVRSGGRPLVLARTRQAASALRNLITAGLGGAVWQPAVTTAHGLCRTVLRQVLDDRWRLLTAPEQEFRVRELLAGHPGLWPPELQVAIGTQGFARQVRGALARARQLGLDPADVERIGERAGDETWAALGRFFAEYLDVLDAEQVIDYAELVHRARIALTWADVSAAVRADAVLVDDYPEYDPAQVGLLAALVPPGGRLLATGDSHTVLSGFRGAHPRAVTDFASVFQAAGGRPGIVVELSSGHRLSRAVAGALAGVARRLGAVVVDGAPTPLWPAATGDPGQVRVLACDSESAQGRAVAEAVRAARLHDGLGYDEIAVVVRSGRQHLAPLARALSRAGVPVRVASEDVPLAASRPVAVLTQALAALAADEVGSAEVAALLTSPIGGLDPLALRRVARAHRALVGGEGLGSAARLARAVNDPSWLSAVAETAWAPALDGFVRAVELLVRARDALERGRPADEVAWLLWQGSGWADSLAAEAAGDGPLAVRAEGDLEALRAFFAFAGEGWNGGRNQKSRRGGAAGVRALLAELAAQQIPADHEREAQAGAGGVEVLTVHRAKGRQWPLVVVVGANEGQWPAPRYSAGVLAPEVLRSDGLVGPSGPREHIAAERRLFYTACAASAGRLVVTFVGGAGDEHGAPSRFVEELGVEPIPAAAPEQPLELGSLVASLRAQAVADGAPASRRAAAAGVLASLAGEVDDRGRPLVPGADPATWWGVHELSGAGRAPLERATLSPSQVSGLLECPRRHFLARRARADAPASAAQAFGTVVHRLVQRAQCEGLTRDGVDAALGELWSELPYEIGWVADAQRDEAARAVGRFFDWQVGRDVEVAGVEQEFAFDWPVDGVELTVRGVVDRLERLPDGRLRVIDFKTGGTATSAQGTAGLEQLGVYQLAVENGAFVAGTESAGASLVFLRLGTADALPIQREQAALRDRPHLADEGADAAGRMVSLGRELSPGAVTSGQRVDESCGAASVGSSRAPGADPGELAHPTWVHHRLAQVAGIVRDGSYPATPGGHCRRCAFAGSCPAPARGKRGW